MFGLLSVMGREPARLDVTAIEDTLCYSIPAEEVQRLISTQPEFASYLIRTSLSRYMDRSLQALRMSACFMLLVIVSRNIHHVLGISGPNQEEFYSSPF